MEKKVKPMDKNLQMLRLKLETILASSRYSRIPQVEVYKNKLVTYVAESFENLSKNLDKFHFLEEFKVNFFKRINDIRNITPINPPEVFPDLQTGIDLEIWEEEVRNYLLELEIKYILNNLKSYTPIEDFHGIFQKEMMEFMTFANQIADTLVLPARKNANKSEYNKIVLETKSKFYNCIYDFFYKFRLNGTEPHKKISLTDELFILVFNLNNIFYETSDSGVKKLKDNINEIAVVEFMKSLEVLGNNIAKSTNYPDSLKSKH